MKAQVLALIAASASSVSAIAYGNSSTPTIGPVHTSTTSCPPLYQQTITATGTSTITYCPECVGPVHTTCYETVYSALCPTGLTDVTYTVTETCSGETPTFSTYPGYVPQGFTVTTLECTACEAQPTVPVTYPVGGSPSAPATYTPAPPGGTPASPAPATPYPPPTGAASVYSQPPYYPSSVAPNPAIYTGAASRHLPFAGAVGAVGAVAFGAIML